MGLEGHFRCGIERTDGEQRNHLAGPHQRHEGELRYCRWIFALLISTRTRTSLRRHRAFAAVWARRHRTRAAYRRSSPAGDKDRFRQQVALRLTPPLDPAPGGWAARPSLPHFELASASRRVQGTDVINLLSNRSVRGSEQLHDGELSGRHATPAAADIGGFSLNLRRADEEGTVTVRLPWANDVNPAPCWGDFAVPSGELNRRE